MLHQTVIADRIEYLVIWDGSVGPRVIEAPEVDLAREWHVARDLTFARKVLLELLAERDMWSTKSLSLASGVKDTAFWGVLQNLERAGQVTRPARGWIALRREI